MVRHLPSIAFVGSLAVLGGLLALWWVLPHDGGTPDGPVGARIAVIVHAAAALRPALDRAAPEFERDTGIKIEVQYGPSEGILNSLRVTGQGDLFLPADDSYVAKARELGLVEQDYPLATMTAVAVIRADFPKDAKDITWDDVFRPGFRLAQPNPDAAAIGKATREGLKPSGLWDRIERTKPAMVGTVTEAANAVKLGSADGAIIWDAVAAGYPTLKVVHLPHLDRVTANVSVAVCKNAASRAEARWFAEYLEGGDGQKHFRALGYGPPRQKAKPAAHGIGIGNEQSIALGAVTRHIKSAGSCDRFEIPSFGWGPRGPKK
jgi:molybdate transport system substrate-binding protein